MAGDSNILSDPNFWVAVAFAGFLGAIIKAKVPNSICKALDERAEKIKIQLDEARELKKEAQKLLASYQRKQKNVEQECNNLLAQAKEEAKNFTKEAETKLKESLARQAKAAEDKIKAAEISAVKEVQTAAAQVSIKAASEALAKDLKSGKSRGLVDDAIKELEKKFH